MLKIKTIKLFLLLSVFIFSIAILVGCYSPTENDKVNAASGTRKIGDLLTLNNAYENGLLSKDDLIKINENYIIKTEFQIDDELQKYILNDYLYTLKEAGRYSDDDIKKVIINIFGYYGEYNGCYIVRITDSFSDYPAVVEEINIGGIIFKYSGPVFMVWKLNE